MPRQYIAEEDKLLHIASCIERAANRKRPKEIAVTLDYLLGVWNKQRGRCAITNLPMQVTRGGCWNGNQNTYVASIDRIDNSKGYVKENVRFVCWFWNDLKATGTDQAVAESLIDLFITLGRSDSMERILKIAHPVK